RSLALRGRPPARRRMSPRLGRARRHAAVDRSRGSGEIARLRARHAQLARRRFRPRLRRRVSLRGDDAAVALVAARQDLIFYTSDEARYAELPDAMSTGSSRMP